MEKLFEIDQYELVTKTKVIVKTVPEKALFPAQEYIHLKSFDGELAISASSSENTTRLVLESAIFDKPFDICIDHSFLKPLTKKEIPLCFSLEGNRCIITCKDSKWEIPVIDPQDFPELERDWKPFFDIESELLKDILHKVSPFTYHEPGNNTSKIHFKNNKKYLCIGATNHFSCCSYKLDLPPDNIDKEIAFLISRDTAALVMDICQENTKMDIFMADDGTLKFQCLDKSVSCVRDLFEGNSTNDYYSLSSRYLEREHDTITIVDKDYFKDQVKKAIAFSPFDMKSLLIHVLKNKLTLEVEDYMTSKRSVQEIEVLLTQKGEVTLMGVPYDHLTRMLALIKSESIELQIPIDHGSGLRCIKDPILIEDQGFVFLLMPLVV